MHLLFVVDVFGEEKARVQCWEHSLILTPCKGLCAQLYEYQEIQDLC